MSITRVGYRRLLWLGTFFVILAAGVLACDRAQRLWSEDASLLRWRQQLALMSEEDAAEYLLGHCGEALDPARLVEALGSQRPLVAFAARDLLMETLDRWQLEPANHTSPHAAEVAEMLAARAMAWEPHAQEAAAQLAARLLRWPTDNTEVDEERFISDCETVLRQRAESREPQVAVATSPQVLGDLPPNYLADSRLPGEPYAEWREMDMGPSEQQFQLPGGNLPIAVAPGLAPDPRLASSDSSVPPIAARAPTPARSPANVPDDVDRTPRAQAADVTPVPAQLIARAPRRINQGSTSPPGHPEQFTVGRSLHISTSPLRELKDIEVMQRLHATDPRVTSDARGELSRRGYRPVHIELARQLTDPSPAVRQRLAENLPGIPSVQALPWLRVLARDDDPEVRLTALSILATSADPATKKWVRDAVRRESDDRVSRELQHLIPR